MQRPITTLAVLLLPVLLASAGLAAGNALVDGTLATREPLTIDGASNGTFPTGALHLHTTQVTDLGVSLEAAELSIIQTWERGERVHSTIGGDDVVRHRSDGGHEVRNLTGAEVTVDPLGGPIELLGMVSATDEGRLSTEDDTHVKLDTIADQVISRVGYTEDARKVGGSEGKPSFWYEVDDPWISTHELDRGELRGDFTLFLHNTTYHVSANEDTFENWTGHRETGDEPISSYETRVTVFRVQDGVLKLRAPDALLALSPRGEVQTDGRLVASDVHGTLAQPDVEFLFDQTRMELTGQGTVSLRTGPSQASASGAGWNGTGSPLVFGPRGGFDVAQTPGLATNELTSAGTQEASAPTGLLSAPVLFGSSLFALTGAVLVRRKVVYGLDSLRARLRERRVSEWMGMGDRLVSVREFERAANWYRQVTKKYANQAEAWYSLAACLVELDAYQEAAEAYERTLELVGRDDPEVVDLFATTAWRAGRREDAVEAFAHLAELDRTRFARRLDNPEFEELQDDNRLEDALDGKGAGLSHYA